MVFSPPRLHVRKRAGIGNIRVTHGENSQFSTWTHRFSWSNLTYTCLSRPFLVRSSLLRYVFVKCGSSYTTNNC